MGLASENWAKKLKMRYKLRRQAGAFGNTKLRMLCSISLGEGKVFFLMFT